MIYVDELKHWPKAKIPGWWCHLCADTHEELLAFADRMGLKRQWIQYEGKPLEHFDLRGKRVRDRAVAFGAREITGREMGHLMSRKVDAA